MANTVMAKMAVQIAANTAEFNKALSKTSKDISSFTSGIKNIGIGLAAAFSIKEVASFALEFSKIAAEAEGVESAFSKIKNSKTLLDDLRRATEGTVSDLKLMKLAVSAVNNNAPLKDLAEILSFIDKTADATGQNFEELANTIIKDIGKGSTRGLNELGLSLETIKKRTDEIGFLPSILEEVRRKSSQLGDITSVTADSYDRLGASLENFKKAIGDFINQKGVSNVLDALSKFLSMWSPGVAQAAFDLKLLNTAIERFNDNQPKAEDFLDAYGKLEERAGKAGVKLILLTDEATGLRKIMIDPRTPFLSAITNEANNAASAVRSTLQIIDDAVKAIEERYAKLNSIARKKFESSLQVEETPNATGTLFDPDLLKIDIKSIFKNLKVVQTEIKPVLQDISGEVLDMSGLVVGGIADITNAFGEAASGSMNFGDAILKSLASFAQQFGALLIAAGIGKISFDKFGGPGMIAAGAALVAIGGAVRGVISHRPSLGGGGSGSSSSSFGSVSNPNSIFFEGGQRNPTIFLEARGASLVAVSNEQGRRDSRIRPNTRRLS